MFLKIKAITVGFFLFGFFLLPSTPTPVQAVMSQYDDFSGPSIDANRWRDGEFVREIRDGNLFSRISVLNSGLFPVDSIEKINYLSPKYSTPTPLRHLQATVVVRSIEKTNAGYPHAGISGMFYNDGTGAVIGDPKTGDAQAQLHFVLSSSGVPKVVWQVVKTYGTSQNFVGSGEFFMTLFLNRAYLLKIQWDPAQKKFDFIVEDVLDPAKTETKTWYTSDTILNEPSASWLGIGTYIAIPDNLSSGKVSATFDDILVRTTGGGVFLQDDFTAAEIDSTKWSTLDCVREIRNGDLVIEQRQVSNGVDQKFQNFRNPDLVQEMESNVRISRYENASNNSNLAARLIGIFYNDTGNPASGITGDVWATVELGGSGSTPVARYQVIRFLNSTTWDTLVIQNFNTPVVIGETYRLYLKWDGAQFTFKILPPSGVEETATYQPATPIYPPNTKLKALNTRVSTPNTNGKWIAAVFEDIWINRSVLFLPLILKTQPTVPF
ncbi:MAG: hypothetical protein HY892_08285 [Deltaproteobacteria bacterium]|nr:hypothetical protein [Deltaproteobacteria bacterium]